MNCDLQFGNYGNKDNKDPCSQSANRQGPAFQHHSIFIGSCRLILFVKRRTVLLSQCKLHVEQRRRNNSCPSDTFTLSHYHSANCVQTLVQCPSNTSRLAQRDSSVVPISTGSSAQRVARGFFLLLLAVCNT